MTRKKTFAARYLALWITLAVGALIAGTIKARRVFDSTDDAPSYIPAQAEPLRDQPEPLQDQPEPLQTELEGAAAAR